MRATGRRRARRSSQAEPEAPASRDAANEAPSRRAAPQVARHQGQPIMEWSFVQLPGVPQLWHPDAALPGGLPIGAAGAWRAAGV